MNRIERLWKKNYSQPSNRAVRWFGLLLTAVLVYFVYRRLDASGWFLIFPAFIPLIGLLYLPLLRFIYAGLMLVTKPIGWLMSYVVLLIVFLVVITPIAIMRNRSFPSGWQKSEPQTLPSKMHE